jgi:hypothetical protein
MAAAAWFARFRLQHDKIKRGALTGRELVAYIAARDELARARALWKNADPEFLARIALDPL